MKKESYKVIVREKLTLAIIKELDIKDVPDTWIRACGVRDNYKEEYDLDSYEVEIIDL